MLLVPPARKVYRVSRGPMDLLVSRACPELRAQLEPQVFKAFLEIPEQVGRLEVLDQLALQDRLEVPE